MNADQTVPTTTIQTNVVLPYTLNNVTEINERLTEHCKTLNNDRDSCLHTAAAYTKMLIAFDSVLAHGILTQPLQTRFEDAGTVLVKASRRMRASLSSAEQHVQAAHERLAIAMYTPAGGKEDAETAFQIFRLCQVRVK